MIGEEIDVESYGTARDLAAKIKNIGDSIKNTFDGIGRSADTLFGEDWQSSGSEGARQRYEELAANYQIFYDKIIEMQDRINSITENYVEADTSAGNTVSSI
ncbi:MAG: WXG100 family type VII secretion target [Bacilli bacterium]|nr:WXG100 family type VII secretion target [Bacilli bacterium]